MMRRSILLIIVAFSLGAFADTVVKNSAAFSFPTTTAASAWTLAQANEASFTFAKPLAGRNVVEFSWNLPNRTTQGSLSVFTVSGVKVKTFPITSSYGTIQWKTMASGIYFAQLSAGSFKKNLQIFLYR